MHCAKHTPGGSKPQNHSRKKSKTFKSSTLKDAMRLFGNSYFIVGREPLINYDNSMATELLSKLKGA